MPLQFGRSRAYSPSIDPRLAVWLRASDAPSGASTSLVDYAHSRTFNGSFTRDTSINGTPTVAFNGSTDGLISASNISEMNGASAFTLILGMAAPLLGGGYKVIAELGHNSATDPDAAIIYQVMNAGEWFAQYGMGSAVNAGTQSRKPPQPDPTTTPSVWVFQIDLADPAAPTCSFWRNNQAPAVTAWTLSANSGAFGNHPLNIGRLGTPDSGSGDAHPIALSFTQFRLYSAALNDADREAASLEVAAASGIVF